MNNKMNVLVFPCGSENASEIHEALRYSLHVRIVGASSVSDHGEFLFENYYGDVPNIKDIEFEPYFKKLVERENISVVFATHDTVAVHLALICENLGVYLVNGNPETVQIARSKRHTYAEFSDQNWVPKVFDSANVSNMDWPVVVKPDLGQGGQGVHICCDYQSLNSAIDVTDNPVIVEFLPGNEITVDCFTDRNKKLVWIGPRTRGRVRAGITMRSESVDSDEPILSIANALNERLVLRGPWFFQLKLDKYNQWKLLEISCRISGTMVFQRARGVNLPLMAVHDAMGRDVIPLPSPFVKLIDRRISTLAFLEFDYKHVYVDLDDTLIIDGNVVPVVIAFLFQCKAQGKFLYLITRHLTDPAVTLRKAKIELGMFDEIIHISDKSFKSTYVKLNSIFIDNHFPERRDVFSNNNVPVFDVDAIQFLIR